MNRSLTKNKGLWPRNVRKRLAYITDILTSSVNRFGNTDWDIDHLDAVVAFIQGYSEEEIFMDLPDGLEFSKEREGDLFVDIKRDYKQSGRAWHLKLSVNLRLA